MSQNTDIINALKAGERLTPIDALNRFGCFRLASRISDLKRKGYEISRKMVHGDNGKSWAEYYMEHRETNSEGPKT